MAERVEYAERKSVVLLRLCVLSLPKTTGAADIRPDSVITPFTHITVCL